MLWTLCSISNHPQAPRECFGYVLHVVYTKSVFCRILEHKQQYSPPLPGFIFYISCTLATHELPFQPALGSLFSLSQ